MSYRVLSLFECARQQGIQVCKRALRETENIARVYLDCAGIITALTDSCAVMQCCMQASSSDVCAVSVVRGFDRLSMDISNVNRYRMHTPKP